MRSLYPAFAGLRFRRSPERTFVSSGGLLCDVLAKLLTFPINTITALLGIPIVIWVVIRNKSIV